MIDEWIEGFPFTVEEWHDTGGVCVLAHCLDLALAEAIFEAEIRKNANRRLTIRDRARVVQRHPSAD
jgi:hypothetical protein